MTNIENMRHEPCFDNQSILTNNHYNVNPNVKMAKRR